MWSLLDNFSITKCLFKLVNAEGVPIHLHVIAKLYIFSIGYTPLFSNIMLKLDSYLILSFS